MSDAGSDSVLRLLVKLHIPINRDSYLNLAYGGVVEENLDAETEEELRGIFAERGQLLQ